MTGLLTTANIDCGGGIVINGANAFYDPIGISDTLINNVDTSNIINTYINFKDAGANSDWCYLRQIGGNNTYKLSFDFHDDNNDARFCIRNINSVNNATTDTTKEVFTVDNGNTTMTGTLTATGVNIGSVSINNWLFNSSGFNHETITDFNNITAFGYRLTNGLGTAPTNGPATGDTQYYSWYIGLGAEYPAISGTSSYGMQFAIGRNDTNPKLCIRRKQDNSWTSWQGLTAEKAVSLTSGDKTISGILTATGGFSGSGASLTSIPFTALSGTSPYLKLDGTNNITGLLNIDAADSTAGGTKGIIFRNNYNTTLLNYNCSILTYDHDANLFCDGLSINGWDGVSFCTGANTRNERMRIDKDGNVGIGTNNPLSILHIEHSSTSLNTSNGGLYVYNPNNTATSSSVIGTRISGTTANKASISLDVLNNYGWSIYITGNDTFDKCLRFNSSCDTTGLDRLQIRGSDGYTNINGSCSILNDLNVTGTINATSILINNLNISNSIINTSNYAFNISNILNSKIDSNNIITSNSLYGIAYTIERQYPPKAYNSSVSVTQITYLGQYPIYFETINLTNDGITYGSGNYDIYSSSTDIATISFTGNGNTLNNVVNDNNYSYISFIDSGTLTLTSNLICDILIVGGGGGGGNSDSTAWESGGGGGGGVVYMVNKQLNSGTYSISVGSGGTNNASGVDSLIADSSRNIVTIDGINLVGKGGGSGATGSAGSGKSGGSGGGGGHPYTNGGLATQGNTFWNGSSYVAGGFNGGKPINTSQGAGGGGAAEIGDIDGRGYGGDGIQVNITGNNLYYAGGGNAYPNTSTTRSDGGGGIYNGGPGLANTGGGGAGGFGSALTNGGNGGSGIVIIRFLKSTKKESLFNYITNEIGSQYSSLKYNSSTGNYITTGITNYIKNDYLGDFLVIKLPTSIILSKFQIYSRNLFTTRAPSLWKLYGSKDNINWQEIIEGSMTTSLTENNYLNGYYEQIVNNQTKDYSYFGIVVNKIIGGNITADTLNFTELKLFGRDGYSIFSGNMQIGSKTSEKGTGPASLLIGDSTGTSSLTLTNVANAVWKIDTSNLCLNFYNDTTTSGIFVNKMQITRAGNLLVSGDISAFANMSDKRLKHNINNLSLNCIDLLNKITPVEFIWNDMDEIMQIKRNTYDHGFIAQDIELLLPNLVNQYDKYKSIKYEKLTPYLVKGSQELYKLFQVLQEDNIRQQQQIIDLQNQINMIKSQLS